MKYVFLAVFIIATAIHLYASLKQDKKMRNMTNSTRKFRTEKHVPLILKIV